MKCSARLMLPAAQHSQRVWWWWWVGGGSLPDVTVMLQTEQAPNLACIPSFLPC
jgi:hypothetical protein